MVHVAAAKGRQVAGAADAQDPGAGGGHADVLRTAGPRITVGRLFQELEREDGRWCCVCVCVCVCMCVCVCVGVWVCVCVYGRGERMVNVKMRDGVCGGLYIFPEVVIPYFPDPSTSLPHVLPPNTQAAVLDTAPLRALLDDAGATKRFWETSEKLVNAALKKD